MSDAPMIEMPDGSPGAVSDAATSLRRVAGGFARGGSVVAQASTTVAGWQGIASVSFDGRVASYGIAMVAVEQALATARGAVSRYEAALEDGRSTIRSLRDQEEMAANRLERAKAQLEDAQGRLAGAQSRMSAVSMSGPLEPAAMADQLQAGLDADAAHADIDAAQKQIDAEREELRELREAAKRERARLVEAEADAASAVRGAAAGLPDVQMPGGAASPSAYAGTVFAGGAASPFANDPRWASAIAKASASDDVEDDRAWYEKAADWTGDQASAFGKGFAEGVVGIGEGGAMLYRMSPTNAILDRDSFDHQWEETGRAVEFGYHNPGEFGKAVVNWEDLAAGRYSEWVGGLGPDAVLAVGTFGVGTAASRGLRGADALGDTADAARNADRVSDAARVADPPPSGTTVYRLHGYNEDPGQLRLLEGESLPDGKSIPSGSWPGGHSWTDVDPFDLADPRAELGLPTGPDGNPARFLSIGELRESTGVTRRDALPLDGNPGGAPELLIPDPENQVQLKEIHGLNPEP